MTERQIGFLESRAAEIGTNNTSDALRRILDKHIACEERREGK